MKITTPRLIIRPFTSSDFPELEKLLSIPEIPEWTLEKEKIQDFLNTQIAQYQKMDIIHGVVCFGIFDREGHILGAAGAGEQVDFGETEIFYQILESERGKGYAVEAAKAMTEWAMRQYDIPYLMGTVKMGNRASQSVLEKCGYKFIEERELFIPDTGETTRFKYYRYYRT
jgi:ribosomal-protein-alanine N-acetyltransferase